MVRIAKASSSSGSPTKLASTTKYFLCPFCVKEKRSNDYTRHMKTHYPEDQLPCPFEGCHKTFPQKTNLENHVNTHTGARPHSCRRGCAAAFGDRSMRNRHERALHSAERRKAAKLPAARDLVMQKTKRELTSSRKAAKAAKATKAVKVKLEEASYPIDLSVPSASSSTPSSPPTRPVPFSLSPTPSLSYSNSTSTSSPTPCLTPAQSSYPLPSTVTPPLELINDVAIFAAQREQLREHLNPLVLSTLIPQGRGIDIPAYILEANTLGCPTPPPAQTTTFLSFAELEDMDRLCADTSPPLVTSAPAGAHYGSREQGTRGDSVAIAAAPADAHRGSREHGFASAMAANGTGWNVCAPDVVPQGGREQGSLHVANGAARPHAPADAFNGNREHGFAHSSTIDSDARMASAAAPGDGPCGGRELGFPFSLDEIDFATLDTNERAQAAWAELLQAQQYTHAPQYCYQAPMDAYGEMEMM